MSIPSAAILKKFGYKWGIIIGLGLMMVGALTFIPAAATRLYPVFLFGLFLLGSGITLLQVAANPYVALLGTPDTASSRLNCTQAINSLGATIGPYLGGLLILSGIEYSAEQWASLSEAEKLAFQMKEAQAVILPYVGLVVILGLIAVMIYFSNLPEMESDQDPSDSLQDIAYQKLNVWKYSHLTMGVLAIFVYVGAEVTIGSFLIKFAKLPHIANLGELDAKNYVSYYMFFSMVGRFLGAALLTRINPRVWLGINALLVVLLLLIGIQGSGYTALWAFTFIGFCNSTMFPNIFTLAIKGLGNHTKEASSYLVMAIVGGAIVPPLMGLVSDWQSDIQVAFYVPLICYVYLVYFGFVGSKLPKDLSPS